MTTDPPPWFDRAHQYRRAIRKHPLCDHKRIRPTIKRIRLHRALRLRRPHLYRDRCYCGVVTGLVLEYRYVTAIRWRQK